MQAAPPLEANDPLQMHCPLERVLLYLASQAVQTEEFEQEAQYEGQLAQVAMPAS